MTKAALYTLHELPQFVVKDDGTNRRVVYIIVNQKKVFLVQYLTKTFQFVRSKLDSMAKLQVALFVY